MIRPVVIAAILAVSIAPAAAQQVRAKADIACKQAGGPLDYDCVVKLANARTNEPLSGVSLSIGADMPSMPGVHHLRPAVATEDAEKGTYRAKLVLDMHGDWALQLNISGPTRDRVVKVLRFEGDSVTEPEPARPRKPHGH